MKAIIVFTVAGSAVFLIMNWVNNLLIQPLGVIVFILRPILTGLVAGICFGAMTYWLVRNGESHEKSPPNN